MTVGFALVGIIVIVALLAIGVFATLDWLGRRRTAKAWEELGDE